MLSTKVISFAPLLIVSFDIFAQRLRIVALFLLFSLLQAAAPMPERLRTRSSCSPYDFAERSANSIGCGLAWDGYTKKYSVILFVSPAWTFMNLCLNLYFVGVTIICACPVGNAGTCERVTGSPLNVTL